MQPFVFEFGSAEIQKQTDIESGRLEVVDDLSLVFWSEGVHGFDLE